MNDDFDQRINALSPAKRALLKRMAQAGERPVERAGERPVERAGERPVERAGEPVASASHQTTAPTRLGDCPIAVLGLDCRFAAAADPAAFWSLLRNGVDAISEVPPERWDAAELFDPSFAARGKVASRWGGFLQDIDCFDAEFFGISPREAAMLDPQHRLILQCAWHALEDAGLPKARLTGSATGVFVSVYQRDYAHLALSDDQAIDAYTASGTHHSIAAGRLSYLYDLRGPCLVVDTACSSSLVAVHLACRSLLAGECDIAIVAAANLMLSPQETMALSRWGMMAADGRCKAFDSRADGFVRGEGAAALVLARLDDAQRDGHSARAVIVGKAMTQDGRSHGLTAPNGQSQQAVIHKAIADAGIDAGAVSYVEAHGTGTALGDPIEIEALQAVYDAAANAPPLWVGSVKTNIGHTEAAAGLAGIIKTVLCLQHGQLVPSLHLRELNPAIGLADSRLRIATGGRAWSGARHAAVSSFGMGGTNAHVVLRSTVDAPVSDTATAKSSDATATLAAPALAVAIVSARSGRIAAAAGCLFR